MSITETQALSKKNLIKKVKDAMIKELTCMLTVGRTDHDLVPYTPDQIIQYINDNMSKIEMAVTEMYNEYEKDSELDDLNNALNDWYREYLYSYIDVDAIYDNIYGSSRAPRTRIQLQNKRIIDSDDDDYSYLE